MKKELKIFENIKKIQNELFWVTLGFNTKPPKSKLKNEKQATCNLKKLSLIMLGISTLKYKKDLVKEQELLMRIADLIIETYIIESAILKTEKVIEKQGLEKSATEIHMTQNYLQNSINIARSSAEEIIMSTTSGFKNKLLLSVCKKFTKPLKYDIKEIRRSISKKLQTETKYTFSI